MSLFSMLHSIHMVIYKSLLRWLILFCDFFLVYFFSALVISLCLGVSLLVPSSLISHPSFVFLFGFIRGMSILSLTIFVSPYIIAFSSMTLSVPKFFNNSFTFLFSMLTFPILIPTSYFCRTTFKNNRGLHFCCLLIFIFSLVFLWRNFSFSI